MGGGGSKNQASGGKKRAGSLAHSLQVRRRREAVIALSDQRNRRVSCNELHEFHRMLPGNVGVFETLKDMHRTGQLDRPVEEEVLAAVLDQRGGDRVRGLAVGGGPLPFALLE